MTPRQQEIALKLMEIYEECHIDCEASRAEAVEDGRRMTMPRCDVCSLIAQYYEAENTTKDQSSGLTTTKE